MPLKIQRIQHHYLIDNTFNRVNIYITGDILHASDVIDEVCERYNVFLIQKKANEQMTEQASLSGESLLDFAGANTTYIRKNVAPKKDEKPTNVIDELGDIFAASSESTNNIAEPLKPVALMPTG